jgi:transposase
MNRRERREWPRRLSLPDPGLEIVHSDAAGMDIGKASHLVAVPPDRDEQPVREFGSWTADLRRLAGWLKPCRIRTVALQSTGVYWIAVLEILEEEGFEVYLVNARGTKNLPGRKSDVQECPWLMKLRTYGLLRNSFRPPAPYRPRKNQPRFDLAPELKRTLGVDLTTIDGIDILTAQVILAELGPDLRAFPTENHFTAWLQLAPRRDISGGKVIRHLKPEGRNRVANALRMAAQALSRSDSYLGARYRSLRGRLGGPRAVKAMARYTACLVYRLLTKGQAYVDRGAAHYETQYRERQKITLQRKAAELGYQLVPAL